MVLITGVAGFIGFHTAKKLCSDGVEVLGIDNLNHYYGYELKLDRLRLLREYKTFRFIKMDICNRKVMMSLAERFRINKICHLAGQAGVRVSIEDPFLYQRSNNEGFLNVIELANKAHVENFVYASSSSVYGNNEKLPFSENDKVDKPVSFYAATKIANEVTAYCYNHLYGIPCSGLRFFTVYGPWGRPDMALSLFTDGIMNKKPIQVFNDGNMKRNFTYIDDVVNGIILTLNNCASCEVYNIGNNKTETLMDFIKQIELVLNMRAIIDYQPMQPGDVEVTEADISKIMRLGYKPETNIDVGVRRFVNWYMGYYPK